MRAPHCGAPGAERPTVAAILRQFPLPQLSSPQVRKVLRRLSRCHTGRLGWALYQCDACASAHWLPLGCGDRHCPQCSARAREAWLTKQRAALLPVRYYHWVFTLPAALRPLALQNQKLIYKLLFDAAATTLLQFGQDRFGAQLGVTALLHTWGQNLLDHPHVHCLVTGGGMKPDGTWQGPKQRVYLFPTQAVATVFKGKFLEGLRKLRPQLEFHGRLELWRDPGVWERTLGALGGTKWIVFAKGSVTGPEAVLEYLGRYTHRVAISNGRLLRMNDRTVTFRYKDYRDGHRLKEMTLAGEEFVRRLSLHILPPGFTKVRHYGILGNNRRKKVLPIARVALESSPWHQPLAPVTPTPLPKRGDAECPRCGSQELQCLGRLNSAGEFTGLARGATRARIRAGAPPEVLDSS